MSPDRRKGPSTSYRWRSEPQSPLLVTRTRASVGSWIVASGTSCTRTSLRPCHTTAFMLSSASRRLGCRCPIAARPHPGVTGDADRARGYRQRVRVLLWHVHGSWTTSFVQGDHEYLLPTTAERDADGRGRAETWQWPDSVREVGLHDLADAAPDVVVLQRPRDLDLLREW